MDKEKAQKTFGTLKGVKILIVDDEKLNQMIIQNMAKLWGADYQSANSGSEALRIIKENNFNIILMDLLMPGLDGFKTTEIIRKENKDIPIIAISGTSTPANIEKLFNAGMNDYIDKPFKINELHEKISKAILKGHDEKSTQLESNENNIDLSYLRESTDNNTELMKQIIEVFLKQTPAAIERLEAALQNEDWNDLRKTSHKMKPTFEYVGIKHLRSLVSEIQITAENQVDLDKLPELIRNLRNLCEKASLELRGELDKFNG